MKTRFIRVKKMKRSAEQMKKTDEEASLSAQRVASIDDLLVEILLRLPMKSLLRFKTVSKHWLSIISNPQFALRRNPNPNPAVGLFLPDRFFYHNFKYQYVPLNSHNPTTPPLEKLRFTKDTPGISIVQSCNGLLLCESFPTELSKRTYYVYNPTTKQLTALPKPKRGPGPYKVIHGIALAFDPSKSPHYRVVCLRKSETDPGKYQIEIYSSEAGPWRASGGPFVADVNFELVAYWNAAVHWISTWGNQTSLYFNVDEERLGVMPMPPLPDGWQRGRKVAYFGESCEHLHLIEMYGPKIQFNVYEMKRDYSEWFVKYQVDLAEVATAFPKMAWKYSEDDEIYQYSLSIFGLIRAEKEEEAFLVVQIPGMAIRYRIVNRNFEKLWELEGADEEGEIEFNEYILVCQHIESLCCV